MNVEQHLLVCLAEECAEVAQNCSKALRFGIDSVSPSGETNLELIRNEFTDVVVMYELLMTELSMPATVELKNVIAKKDRLAVMMQWSRKAGVLDEN